MPCAACWPAGPSLCSSLPFIGAGLSPPQAGHLPTFLSPRTTPQKTAAAQGFVLTAFSLFFAALSPRYKLSKLFLPAAVKKYVAKPTLQGQRVGQKLPFDNRKRDTSARGAGVALDCQLQQSRCRLIYLQFFIGAGRFPFFCRFARILQFFMRPPCFRHVLPLF